MWGRLSSSTTSRQSVLGTVLSIRVSARSRRLRSEATTAIERAIERLNLVFSMYEERSEFSRWRSGSAPATSISHDLLAVLTLARQWQLDSDAAFNPAAGILSDEWAHAQTTNIAPSRAALRALAQSVREPRYDIAAENAIQTGDCSRLNLNAIAKGYIVDQAAHQARALRGVTSVVVNIGGDLCHLGNGFHDVGIENPHRPYDNEPPISTVRIANQALATSGFSRRGFTVDGAWFSHVIDPRSGWPATAVASASVIAPTAITADAVATVLSVMPPAEGAAFADQYADLGYLLVSENGHVVTNATWQTQSIHRRPIRTLQSRGAPAR